MNDTETKRLEEIRAFYQAEHKDHTDAFFLLSIIDEQAARHIELLGVAGQEHTARTLLQMKLNTQAAQLKEAVEALEYYAHPDHYEEVMRISGLRPPGVLVEKGEGARKALAKIRGGM